MSKNVQLVEMKARGAQKTNFTPWEQDSFFENLSHSSSLINCNDLVFISVISIARYFAKKKLLNLQSQIFHFSQPMIWLKFMVFCFLFFFYYYLDTASFMWHN